MSDDRIEHCTKENPWSDARDDGKDRVVMHDDAKMVGEPYDIGAGPVAYFRCPHCGEYFAMELPTQ